LYAWILQFVCSVTLLTVSSLFTTLNQQNVQTCASDIYTITLNIPTCFGPHGNVIKESNQSNTT